jgi:hypothetical protein
VQVCSQQIFPPPAARELRQEPEVGDLHRLVVVALELEVSGRRAVPAEQPERDPGIGEMGADALVAPGEAVGPVVPAADFGVEIPKERRRALFDALDPGFGIGRRGGT